MPEHRRTISAFTSGTAFLLGSCILILITLAAIFADLLSPNDYTDQNRSLPSAPASSISFSSPDGSFSVRPSVQGVKMADALTRRYESGESSQAKLDFFVRGYPYKLFGFIPAERHLIGVERGEGVPKLFILGTDELGRDRFARLLHAVRFSLVVSFISVVLASLLGILIGIVSGYSPKFVDSTLIGITDSVIALPALILILAARAAFPLELPPLRAAIMLIGIFALAGWGEMARLARSLVRTTREREFVMAATATGVRPFAILTRHILPNILRPLITQATLLLPVFLLAENALSFLGIGLQEPEPSLGNMLADTMNAAQLREHPFLMLSPAIVIAIFVFAVRLVSNRSSDETDH